MITIYAKTDCVWCEKAKELATQYGLKHTYLNVSENDDYAFQLYERKSDVKTLPQIWWHNRYIGGYTDLASEIENTMGGYGDGKI
jgi:glutaredoxin 3